MHRELYSGTGFLLIFHHHLFAFCGTYPRRARLRRDVRLLVHKGERVGREYLCGGVDRKGVSEAQAAKRLENGYGLKGFLMSSFSSLLSGIG
eukprot:2445171-Pleurochrysis_carterae.AAC.1